MTNSSDYGRWYNKDAGENRVIKCYIYDMINTAHFEQFIQSAAVSVAGG